MDHFTKIFGFGKILEFFALSEHGKLLFDDSNP